MRRQLILLNVAGTVLFTVAAFACRRRWSPCRWLGVILLAPAANATLSAAQARTTPEHMRGRVSSTVFLTAMSLTALAPLTAGLIVQDSPARGRSPCSPPRWASRRSCQSR